MYCVCYKVEKMKRTFLYDSVTFVVLNQISPAIRASHFSIHAMSSMPNPRLAMFIDYVYLTCSILQMKEQPRIKLIFSQYRNFNN